MESLAPSAETKASFTTHIHLQLLPPPSSDLLIPDPTVLEIYPRQLYIIIVMCWHVVYEYVGCLCLSHEGVFRCLRALRKDENCDRREWGRIYVPGLWDGMCPGCQLPTPPTTPRDEEEEEEDYY
jgi:hypothetical protein